MIKKPKSLTKPDLLRLPRGEEQLAIEKRNQEFRDYESYVVGELVKEFGTGTLGQLLIMVTEKYHPKLKIKETKGAKKIWNDFLCALVAVEINTRRKSGDSLKKVVNDLCKEPIWKQFVRGIDGEEQFKKVYKDGKKSRYFRIANQLHALPNEWESLIKEELKLFKKSK